MLRRGRQDAVQPQVVRFLAVVIRPVCHRNEGCRRPRHVHAEHRDRVGQLRVVHACKGLLTELEGLFEPCDELLLGRGAVYRRALRHREAGGVAAEDVVALVREVHLDLCEAHLRRRGTIVVLVRGAALGGGRRNSRRRGGEGGRPRGGGGGWGGGGGGGGGGQRRGASCQA